MPLFAERKICFIHIPKTGGTSIEVILNSTYPNEMAFFHSTDIGPIRMGKLISGIKSSPQHALYREINSIVNLSNYYCFAFVRNPYDRLYSDWKWWNMLHNKHIPFQPWVNRMFRLQTKNTNVFDNHIRPQCDFLDRSVEIYRFENFQDEVRRLLNKLNIMGQNIPHIFKTSEQNEYLGHYSLHDRKMVRKFYHKDFDRFGY
jgi:hypothetical protein